MSILVPKDEPFDPDTYSAAMRDLTTPTKMVIFLDFFATKLLRLLSPIMMSTHDD